ncbi:MAG TPA: hypothetical protein DDW23_03990 [Planctomycetes bacterium]|nr:hypothetical protein [Planctomycetota bacterium]
MKSLSFKLPLTKKKPAAERAAPKASPCENLEYPLIKVDFTLPPKLRGEEVAEGEVPPLRLLTTSLSPEREWS